MNNLETIVIFEATRNECKAWINNAHIILSGKSVDHLDEPFLSTDCQLGLWIEANEKSVVQHPELFRIKEQHDECHNTYIRLYNETLRIYNPKTHDELQEYLVNLELETKKLEDLLNHAEKLLTDNPNQFLPAKEEGKKAEKEKDDDIKNNTNNESTNSDTNGEVESTTIEALQLTLTETIAKAHIPQEHISVTGSEETEEGQETTTKLNEKDNSISVLDEVNENKIDKSIEVSSQTSHSDKKDPEITDLKNDLNNTTGLTHIDIPPNVLTMQEGLQQQLKELDLKQLEQEKKITQQELNAIEERQKLTKQAVDKLEQYQSLEKQGLINLEDEYSEISILKTQEQEIKKQELIDLEKNQQEVLEEIKQETTRIEEVELKNLEEKQLKLTQYETLHKNIQKQFDQYSTEINFKKSTLEKLEKTVLIVKKEIEQFKIKQDAKNRELEVVKAKKTDCKLTIQEDNDRLKKLIQQQQNLKEETINNATNIEEQQAKITSNLKIIAQDLVNLKQQKQKTKEQKAFEIAQLDNQKQVKLESLDELEKRQQQKKQELTQLELQYTATHNEFASLKNSESTKNNLSESTLEEA